MNLLYCGDQKTRRGILLSILSILKHDDSPIHVHILTATIPTVNKTYLPILQPFASRLEEVMREVNSESSVVLHDITQLFFAQPPSANMKSYFTPCCMLRLYADCVPGMPDKLLYLDYDVLANATLHELWETDITDVEFAGVLDYYGRWFFRKKLTELDYINSGVLLLNLNAIRRTGLFEKCRALCAEKKMFMPDQAALNTLAASKLLLPRRFNEQRIYSADTVLQHFSTSFRFFPYIRKVSIKPWEQERMHRVLKLHAYDDVLETYSQVISTF